MARVRLKQHWEVEVEGLLKDIRSDYSDTSHLLYLIHPGVANDCDYAEAAKEGVRDELNRSENSDQRAILIYPTQKGTYVDASKVTDIRGGTEGRKWVDKDDLNEVTKVSFVGGKLMKCLGYSYHQLMLHAKGEGDRSLQVRLPLDAIYTGSGHTAAQEFLAGKAALGEKKSLYALLTAVNKALFYLPSSLEYGFLHSPFRLTKLYLNGDHLTTFENPQNEVVLTEGWEMAEQNQPSLSVDLLIEYDASKEYENASLAAKATGRWEQIASYFSSKP